MFSICLDILFVFSIEKEFKYYVDYVPLKKSFLLGYIFLIEKINVIYIFFLNLTLKIIIKKLSSKLSNTNNKYI